MVDEHIDHLFGMLAVSFQLFNFYLSQLMSIEIHNYCFFVFKMSLGQQKSDFLNLKPYKTNLKLLRKKSHNLHYLSHNWPFYSHNLP